MRIGSSISSLKAIRLLAENAKAISRALEQLSSGKRITRAADDASGLAIASGLEAKIRGLSRATQNVNEAKAVLNTADGALASLTDIIQRMRELAVQASNGFLSANDRNLLNQEFTSLFDEYNRITQTTEFNGNKILDGSFSASIQVGTEKSQSLHISSVDTRAGQIFKKTLTTTDSSYEESGSSALSSTQGTGWRNRSIFEDVDGDGDLDMISSTTPSAVGVRLSNGDGTYGSATTYNLVTGLSGSVSDFSFRLGDINGDGDVDLVSQIRTQQGAIGITTRSYLVVRLGNGDGTFSATNTATLIEEYTGSTVLLDFPPANLVLADVDNDGIDEITYYDVEQEAVSSGTNDPVGYYVYNYTAGSFSEVDYQAAGVATPVLSLITRAGDFNGDGHEDIISLGSTGNIAISLGGGSGIGAFSTLITPAAGENAKDYLVSDFDQDGDEDIVVIGNIISLLENDGTGSFTEVQTWDLGSTYNAAQMADVNSDGNLDLILSTLTGVDTHVAVLTQNSENEFSLANEFTSENMRSFVLDNIDGDGDLEFLGFSTTALSLFDLINTTTITEEIATQNLRIDSQEFAQDVLEILDSAQDNLLEKRAQLGAIQTRLNFAENAMSLTKENLAAARSHILDADVAAVMGELVQRQVMQQAQIAVLSQANIQAKAVLALLLDLDRT